MHRTLFFLLLLLASCKQVKEVEPDIPCHLRYPHTCKPLVLLEGTKPDFKGDKLRKACPSRDSMCLFSTILKSIFRTRNTRYWQQILLDLAGFWLY
jgi:hypothetical protein